MLAAPRDYAAFSRGHSSVMPMIRAMATETVVDPAMANWRSPIWPTKHTPNNPARDRTDRTGNHKARTRSSSGTDHVGTCGSRDRCDCHDDRDCEHKVAHLISPPEEILLRQVNAQNMTSGPVASPTVAVPLSSLTHRLRQLGDIRRDPPRLVFGEQLGGGLSPRLVLERPSLTVPAQISTCAVLLSI